MVEYGSGLKLSMVTDDGLNEVLRNMRSLSQIIAYESALAVAEGVVTLMGIAQERVPIDTGELRELHIRSWVSSGQSDKTIILLVYCCVLVR